MKIEFLLLCDKASVREGLLHMLGGGVAVLYRDRLPAPMATDLVVALSGPSEEFLRPHRVAMTIKSEAGVTIAEAELGWDAAEGVDADENLPTFVPLIIPLAQVGVPTHERYAINVRLDGKAARRLDFSVRPGPLASRDRLVRGDALRR